MIHFSFLESLFLVYIAIAAVVKIIIFFKCRKVKSPCYSKCVYRFLCEKYGCYNYLDQLDDLLEMIKEKERQETEG